MQKYAIVDSERCNPERCRLNGGSCIAVHACTHNIMEQESPYDVPVLWSTNACVGCGDCVSACPLDAIFIQNGSVVMR